MTDKIWAHHPGGIVSEVTAPLPAEWVPGKTIFADWDLKDVTDVTALNSKPVTGWVLNSDGQTFSAPAEPGPIVPASVTSSQAKIQLLRTPGSASGKTLLEDVTSAVQKAGGEVAIWFSDARTWERANPYVLQLGTSLNLKAADIDALFIAAAKIAA